MAYLTQQRQKQKAPSNQTQTKTQKPTCQKVFLGPDVGFVNVMQYHDSDGSCRLSIQELGKVCTNYYTQCISFLNSGTKNKPGNRSAVPVNTSSLYSLDGWFLMTGNHTVLDIGGAAETEFMTILRRETSNAIGIKERYIAILSIEKADNSTARPKNGTVALHVNFELTATSKAAAQAMFSKLLNQSKTPKSKLRRGTVSGKIGQISKYRHKLEKHHCDPVFLGPDIGYVNIRKWDKNRKVCQVSMTQLATTCNAFMAECIAFLNSAKSKKPPPQTG